MKKIIRITLFSSLFIIGCSLLVTGLYFGINYSMKKIYVANFNSYTNPDLIKNMRRENNVSMKYFATSEECEREFKNNYNVAITSSYSAIKLINKDNVAEIDWNKLSSGMIKDEKDALKIFTPEIQNYLQSFDIDGDGKNDNLLKWSIPYFIQSMVIAYKSNQKIIENSLPNNLEESNKSFKELINYFENKQFSGIAYEDYRSLFSLSMIFNQESNVNVFENKDINFFKDKYNSLFSKFKNNKIIFNSDPSIVINNFVRPNGKDFSIMYNGDLLWALYGGDELNEKVTNKPFDNSKINFFQPYNSPKALDLLIINKNKYYTSNEKSKENINDIVRKLTFDGVKLDANGSSTYDEEGWAFKNFDFIYYTTPYDSIYKKVLNSDFFPEKKFKDVFSITNINRSYFEEALSNLNKRNLLAAFFEVKNSLG